MKNENWISAQKLTNAKHNELLFWRIGLGKNSEFLRRLADISQAFSPFKSHLIPSEKYPLKVRVLHRDKILSLGSNAADSLGEEKQSELLMAVDSLLSAHKLGREWRDPIITYTMTGVLCPPVFNLHMEGEAIELGGNKERFSHPALIKIIAKYGGKRFKVRTVLYLNPGTSQKDIQVAWPEIKKIKRLPWPDYKGFNLTKNSEKTLDEQRVFLIKKLDVTDEEKYAKLSDYEERVWKQEKLHGKSDAEIMKTLRGRPTEDGSRRKSVSVKSRKTDLEVARELLPGKSKKELRRYVNKIRKRRQRLKR